MITLAVVGAGLRGQFAYPPYTKNRDDIKFLAVADLDPLRVKSFKETYGIADEMCFNSGEEFFKQPKCADAVLICTMDQDHYTEAIKAIELGYDILLEKPIAAKLEDCLEIERLAKEHGTKILVCHVLRYTPFYKKMKEILMSGVIGQLINVEAMENVGHWHQAHSFVRGNWSNEDDTTPMILQKCCHDMDIYSWLINSECESLLSYGDLTYFNSKNAPKDSPVCCLDECPARATCPYDVYKTYLNDNIGWPTNAICADMAYESRLKALQSNSYGKCVFHSNNNVVDHQTINMKYQNGVIMNFTMTAFTQECDRTMRFMGTKGEISANMNANQIKVTDFLSKETTVIDVEKVNKGHGGGDYGIMEEFIRILKEEKLSDNLISASIHSHVLCFAAEVSRKNKKHIFIDEFLNK